MSAKLGDNVFYFPDYGSVFPVPMTAKVISIQGGNPVLNVDPADSNIGGFILDNVVGIPAQATNLPEALNPGNKWATTEQVEAWGLLPDIGV